MNWLHILSLICLLLGLISGILGLRSMRSKKYAEAEISWQQPPLSPWRYETPSMVVISIHTLGLISLTAFLLFSVTRHPMFTSPSKSNFEFFVFLISMSGIVFTSHTTGVMSAYHIAQPWIRPVSYGIGGEGLLYGGSVVSWQSFSHYEVGPEDGLISLYSSYSPGLRTWVIQPPPESFTGVLGWIQKNLPSLQVFDDSISWQRSPFTLVIGMTLLILGALLPTVWGWVQGQSWVWIYAFVAFLFVLVVGTKLITVFDGRSNSLVKREER